MLNQLREGPFTIKGETFSPREVLDALNPYLTPERRERIRRVVARRTYSVVPVLEGLYDNGNVCAVLRSAEALGLQEAHIIELSVKHKEAKRVTQGAEKWLDIRTWGATKPCLDRVKEKGYRILAAHVGDARLIETFDFTQPTAVLFGNERDGLSRFALDRADDRVVVPMLGFTRSFNISVAAALCFYHIVRDRCARMGRHGDLTETQVERLTASFYLRSLATAEDILLDARKRG